MGHACPRSVGDSFFAQWCTHHEYAKALRPKGTYTTFDSTLRALLSSSPIIPFLSTSSAAKMKLLNAHLFPLLILVTHTSSTALVRNATYDDLDATALIGNTITAYKNLTYNAWVVGTPQNLGGVASESQPNSALTAIDQQTLHGTPSFSVASPFKSFSPLDFYFGCTLRTDEGVLGVATQCTITVAGFTAGNNKEVALASFTFTPPDSPVTPVSMIHAVLPDSFKMPLYNVTMIQDNKLAALKIDNFHYDVST
ncbi:hypothetical protein BDR22DRAFT_906423 [Usnea florida]